MSAPCPRCGANGGGNWRVDGDGELYCWICGRYLALRASLPWINNVLSPRAKPKAADFEERREWRANEQVSERAAERRAEARRLRELGVPRAEVGLALGVSQRVGYRYTAPGPCLKSPETQALLGMELFLPQKSRTSAQSPIRKLTE